MRATTILMMGVVAGVTLLPTAVDAQTPMGTALTYQGRLEHGGAALTDTADFEFRLFDALSDGNPVGVMVPKDDVQVTDGLFTVQIDFGVDAFNGQARYLEIAVKRSADPEFTTLSPRQELTPAPYATHTRGLVVDADGDVGIGTSSPMSKLEVAGMVHATSGGFKLPDGSIISSAAWLCTGNSGTTSGTHFVGTTDNQPLELKSWGLRVMRLEAGYGGYSPNIIGGYNNNSVTTDVYGATIAGGGESGLINRVTDDFGTVGGGRLNQAGDNAGFTYDRQFATVGGGTGNTASGRFSTIGAGADNDALAQGATVGGGEHNYASGQYATIAGGQYNDAQADFAAVGGGQNCDAMAPGATVGGGNFNRANSHSATVGGGENNEANGQYATVPGGFWNVAQGDYSHAAGRQAKANHAGTFVWADSEMADFASTGDQQFLIRAQGGVGVGTNDPKGMLHVHGGSIAQWSEGTGSGYGKTSVFTDQGTLDAGGDFTVTLPTSMCRSWHYDNYIFKVEVFVALDYDSSWPHSNRGSAYSMALIGKQRGAGFVYFNEMMTHANGTAITFTYSSSVQEQLDIAVDTNRDNNVSYRVTVKTSH